MDANLWSVFIGIVSGAVGYWLTTFCMQPILRYRQLRNQVLMEFIYYKQVVNAEGMNEKIQELYQERRLANRKTSALLSASIQDLPCLYIKYLKYKGLNPKRATKHLIGYSNTTEYEQSNKKEDAIRKQLGLPPQE